MQMLNNKKLMLKLVCLFALLTSFASQTRGAFAASWTGYAPQPTGIVKVTRPTISFQITPTGDTQISAVYMSLNQTLVPVSYSNEKHVVLYQPVQPLLPGNYDVKCRVVLDGSLSCDKEWQFTVATDAVNDLSEPTAQQKAVFEAVNKIRRSIGKPPFLLDNSLCAAAQAHSHYLSVYRESGHNEQIERLGATGAKPQDRASAFGYGFAISEDVAGDSSPLVTTPVTGLFNAPYHRIPFLQPDASALGTGYEGKDYDATRYGFYNTTLDFGPSASETIAVSPFPDQQDIPTQWDGNESPNPLRLYPASTLPVGYVVVFAHFGPWGNPISLSSATLTTATGETVAVFVNTPNNDDRLRNAAFIIPQKPLAPNTTYHVSVKAMTDDGLDISREWNFTTGADSAGDENDLESARFRAVALLPTDAIIRRRKPAGFHIPSGGFIGLTRLQVTYANAHLQVTFPKNITHLQCYFDGSATLTKSSPPVHEAHGSWLAQYSVPVSAHTYRLVIDQGAESHVVLGLLSRYSILKRTTRIRKQ